MPIRALQTGIVNVGNTCWLSAAALLLTQLPTSIWARVGEHSHTVLRFLQQLHRARWSEAPTAGPPAKWTEELQQAVARASISPGYGVAGAQHDPAELVEYVVSTLLSEDRTAASGIKALLGRSVCTITQCQACSKTLSRASQPAFLMHLTVSNDGRPVTLAECIAAERASEVVTGRCECSGDAEVQLNYRAYEEQLPKALLVLLRRTAADGTKVRTQVQTPRNLSLVMREPDGRKTNRYELHGVVQHYGGSTRSGHYVYYGAGTGCWHRYDDELVTTTDALDPKAIDRDAVMALYLPISAADNR